jgi:hypothetical protein
MQKHADINTYIYTFHILYIGSRDSSFGIQTCYGLVFDSRQAGARNFSLFYNVQTGSAAHPFSYAMVTGGCFP